MTRRYVFPASFAQERLWFLSRLEPDVPVQNLNMRIDLPGDIDPGRLRQALGGVVERHEALRTALAVEDGDLVQIVEVELPVTLAVSDLTAGSGDREEAFAELAAREAAAPFELGSAPLWRAHLVRVAADDWRLLLIAHHAVFDARSGDNLLAELMEIYDAIGRQRPPRLPDLPVQYADYAAWQRGRLGEGTLADLLGYWRRQLDGIPADLGLPRDRPRPARRSYAGAEYHVNLPADFAARVEALAKGRGVTLFMVLLAGFTAVLGRFAGRQDVVVGSPVSGRELPEVEPLIGMFVNMLVLRTGLHGDPAFTELLERVRTTVVDALDHAEVPFDRLVEALRPHRDPSTPPIYQVGFNLLPLTGRYQFSNGTAQLDLTMDVIKTEDGIGVWVEYSTELFDEETVARLVTAYRVLLEAAVADPGLRLSELPLMTEGQRRRLLVEANATDAWYPARPLHELIAEQARRVPGATAVRTAEGTELTYAELDERSAALARALRARGVTDERCVAVYLPRDATLIVALLAVLRAGACYLPLDPAYPPERLKYILGDSGACLVLTRSDLRDRLPAERPPELLLDAFPGELEPPYETGGPVQPLPEVSPDQLAYIIYTSGSTGRPKGVEVPHRGLVNLVTDVAREQGGGDVLLLTSLSFDIAALEIFTPLLSGGTLAVTPDEAVKTPKEVRGAAEKADLVQLTPSVAEMLLGELPHGLPQIICGGEPLPADLARRLLDITPRLWNFYGPTETTVWSTRMRITRDSGPVGIGGPVANTRVYVVDGGLRPVPVGVAGELLIGGVGLARGYLGRPDLTGERFVPDVFGGGGGRLYRTGDLVRWRGGGVLEFLGRLDDQVKVRGVRIELDEVAAVLGEHPLVRRAVVVVRDDAPGGRGLVAYVDWAGERAGSAPVGSPTPSPADAWVGEGAGSAAVGGPTRSTLDASAGAGQPEVAARLREHVRARLPEAMVPAAYVVVDRFPTLPSGKLDRAALPAPARERPERRPRVAPRTEQERALHAMWTELLDDEHIGVDDDFFALGGHSLLAMRLVTRLREAYGVNVPLRRCFETPTIAGLASLLPARPGPAGTGPIPPAGEGPVRPSHAQARLWFMDQLDPGNPVYNVAWGERLIGPLDAEALAGAFDALVDRHEILRMVIVDEDGEPLLAEGPHRPRLETRDLSATPDVTSDVSAATSDAVADVTSDAVVDVTSGAAGDVTSDVTSGAVGDVTSVAVVDAKSDAAAVAARDEARHRFDLAEGPLIRATLLRTARDEHHLLLTLHHVVTDRWSLSILLRDLMELYRARIHGDPARLPELTVGFRDYAAWRRDRLDDGALDYWKRTLAALPDTLDLPADRRRPGRPSFEGRRLTFVIDEETVAAVRAFAQARRATPFTVLLAALQGLLARYTGRTDIPIGTPVSARDHPALEEVAGLFLNTLVLRGDVSGDPDFTELLRRAQERVLEAHDHAGLPFEVLVEELAETRSLSRNPLFQVMFAYQNVPPAPPEVAGLALRTLDVDPGVAQVDLHLVVEEAGDRLIGVLHYATDLFDHDRMERFADHYRAFLAGAVAAPEAPVSGIPVLTATERNIIQAANATGRDYVETAGRDHVEAAATATGRDRVETAANATGRDRVETAVTVGGPPGETLHGLVARQAARTPTAPALGYERTDGGRAWLTYAEFAARVNRLARRLRTLGVGPDRVVGVCLERGADLVLAVHAVLAAGGAYLPLEPDHPAERLALMTSETGTRLVVTTAATAASLPGGLTRVLLDEDADLAGEEDGVLDVGLVGEEDGVLDVDLAGEEDGPPDVDVPPDALAYVIFTSGSTGRPKGVGVSHRSIANRLRWMQETFGLGPADRVLHKTPFSFDVSVWELFWPLMAGAGLVVARPGGHADPAYLAGLIEAESVTTLHFVPSLLDAFLDEPRLGTRLAGVRTVVCSGEALPAELAGRLLRELPAAGLHNLYGPTEAAVDVSWHACAPGESTVPIGRPIANTRLEILDARLDRVPIGVPGRLWIGGVQLARGYVNRPGLTAERFVPDPLGPPGARLYDTGDLARWRPDGEIEYLGRTDFQVKIRGMRVELGEIEAALGALPGVRAAAVHAVEDGAGLRLAGYVVPESPLDAAPGREWREALAERLPDHMIPRSWVLLDELPVTGSGKLDRRALPLPRADDQTVHDDPRGPAEVAVAEAWRAVLALDRVSAHDNFFAAGGDSIRSLKVVARLRKEGYAVRLEQIFLHQTVRELAGRLRPAEGETGPEERSVAAFGLLNPDDMARLLGGEMR
ncbi:hypothetical protein GCM10022226_40280 [Sphaerisporangium flaviroseum]|uniref:Carrier domain-containing protein n=1 Tax=Sphaerisporangium flaviroseum TaxID=509199 RepID=A0ABP7IDD6_9ACTN